MDEGVEGCRVCTVRVTHFLFEAETLKNTALAMSVQKQMCTILTGPNAHLGVIADVVMYVALFGNNPPYEVVLVQNIFQKLAVKSFLDFTHCCIFAAINLPL